VPIRGTDLPIDVVAFAVGFTASLSTPEDLSHQRYDQIELRANAMVQAVRESPRL
jgi:hypothetical protein